MQSPSKRLTDPPIESTATPDVHITGLDGIQFERTQGQSPVRVSIDAGGAGYGEAGTDGPTVRAQHYLLERDLLGADPLEVEKHYDCMARRQHTFRPHTTVSGVDIAL